jgi:hypothetical protein
MKVKGHFRGLVACLNRKAALPSMESRIIAELVVAFVSLRLQIALPPRQPRALACRRSGGESTGLIRV